LLGREFAISRSPVQVRALAPAESRTYQDSRLACLITGSVWGPPGKRSTPSTEAVSACYSTDCGIDMNLASPAIRGSSAARPAVWMSLAAVFSTRDDQAAEGFIHRSSPPRPKPVGIRVGLRPSRLLATAGIANESTPTHGLNTSDIIPVREHGYGQGAP